MANIYLLRSDQRVSFQISHHTVKTWLLKLSREVRDDIGSDMLDNLIFLSGVDSEFILNDPLH